jgi:hypothetical protein
VSETQLPPATERLVRADEARGDPPLGSRLAALLPGLVRGGDVDAEEVSLALLVLDGRQLE